VQGHLRGEPLTLTVETECAHCARPIRLQIDGNLNAYVLTEGAEPMVFVPTIDFSTVDDPSIIDVF
jgi:hypothetical protein